MEFNHTHSWENVTLQFCEGILGDLKITTRRFKSQNYGTHEQFINIKTCLMRLVAEQQPTPGTQHSSPQHSSSSFSRLLASYLPFLSFPRPYSITIMLSLSDSEEV